MRWHVGGCEQGCREWNLFATGKTFFADCFLSLHANTSTLALHTHTCSCHWLKSKCECNCLNSINSMPRCSPCFSSLLSARQTGQRLHLLAGDSQMNCELLHVVTGLPNSTCLWQMCPTYGALVILLKGNRENTPLLWHEVWLNIAMFPSTVFSIPYLCLRYLKVKRTINGTKEIPATAILHSHY